MNIWEAKYKALSAGISDKTLIDNAEKLVEASCRISAASMMAFDKVVYHMLSAVHSFREPVEAKDFEREGGT